jgi:hypothetical protein
MIVIGSGFGRNLATFWQSAKVADHSPTISPPEYFGHLIFPFWDEATSWGLLLRVLASLATRKKRTIR